MTGNNDNGLNRRTYVKGMGLAGTAGVAGLAGCTGGGDDDNGGDNENKNDDGSGKDGNTDYKKLELQHWWTGGDGHAAITALLDGFKEEYPDIEVKPNPIAGGAGQNLKDVVKKRVLQGKPPSSWQAWPGKNLTPYVDNDILHDISDSVWSENGMKDAYRSGPKEVAKLDGKFVAVPLNIHRLNNLFYNTKVVEDAGVDPKSISKPSDLTAAMKKVESNTDAVGMAQQTKSPWSTLQLWAQVLLGESGVKTYNAVMSGKVDANKKAVKNALSIVKEYKAHFNKDSGSLDWQQANKKILKGEAAFFHQGDWAASMYREQENFEYEKQWNHVPFPGTEKMYALNMDSFPFPKQNPSPEATKKFLQYVGSKDAQERFNPKKGSIPPRTDVSKEKFGPFLSQQMDDFKNSKSQPPSVAHGLATTPETLTNLKDATASFISNWNVDKTANQFSNSFN
ncbi:ABC transporter substrate-binding protein [Haladaptatus sp. T7]|uniref:ABC transporter substrate-binding protein n=1 Tax=Haladaptatus sp. T7 TaxID=2029368 RepID=UPI0021A25113|nr:ABC transporter substrate-binding protein [Haladaptatus sp. T7]GKZ13704.1 ABC transporter substrate-binding protein [Haladaptatus sp. T7]